MIQRPGVGRGDAEQVSGCRRGCTVGQANAGAIATQSYANTTFGPRGLRLMAKGLSARETLDRLLAADQGRAQRQVGIVDREAGRTFTGAGCHAWAGGSGRNFAAQGNILARAKVVEAIAAKLKPPQADWPID